MGGSQGKVRHLGQSEIRLLLSKPVTSHVKDECHQYGFVSVVTLCSGNISRCFLITFLSLECPPEIETL